MIDDSDLLTPRIWMRRTLQLAGVYNLVWGAAMVVAPLWSLRLSGYVAMPVYPEFWQCIGMFISVFGIGYWIAAGDPFRHWPIVLVGFLGKIFGPVGFAWSWMQGSLPLSAGRFLLLNDVIWWIPFGMILWNALRYEQSRNARQGRVLSFEEALGTIRSQTGETLRELSEQRPVLVLFLRHAGCTFCRASLADLADRRAEIERSGGQLAVVDLGDHADPEAFLEGYGLGDVPRFADPHEQLYRAFQLPLGTFGQLMGMRIWWRGFLSAIIHRHGFGRIQANAFRMPGAFVVHRGRIIAADRSRTAADRPDYDALVCEMPSDSNVTSTGGPKTSH